MKFLMVKSDSKFYAFLGNWQLKILWTLQNIETNLVTSGIFEILKSIWILTVIIPYRLHK